MYAIRFRIPNIRFFEGEDGGGTGGAPVDNGGQVSDSGQAEQQPEGGINPSWTPMLDLIPAQLHEGVKPYLKQWDDNFQKKLSEVQSQNEPLKRFEAFADQDPERIQQALQFFQMAEADPRKIYEELGNFYKFGEGDQGQQGQEDIGQEEVFGIDDDAILQHPKVQELLQGQEVLAQYLLTQKQQEEQRQLESEIDTEHQKIVTENPDFSEDDLVMMYQVASASNISLTDAAARIKQYNEGVATRHAAPYAPSVISANGVIPAAQSVDPTKLSRQDTKKLVADLIRQSQAEG